VLAAYEEEPAALGRRIPLQPGPLFRSLNGPSVLLSHDVVHAISVKVHLGPSRLHPGHMPGTWVVPVAAGAKPTFRASGPEEPT